MSADSITVKESTQRFDAMKQLAKGFFADNNLENTNDLLADSLGVVAPVSYEQLPDAYNTLLNHDGHMTITLEAWHNSPVDVHVVDEVSTDDFYSRHSLLTRQSDNQVVQSGIMKIRLQGLPTEAQQAIKNGSEPLGRILIRSGVLREVEVLALWEIKTGSKLAEEFGIEEGQTVFGRTACIFVDGNPAVELLEIVTP